MALLLRAKKSNVIINLISSERTRGDLFGILLLQHIQCVNYPFDFTPFLLQLP